MVTRNREISLEDIKKQKRLELDKARKKHIIHKEKVVKPLVEEYSKEQRVVNFGSTRYKTIFEE